MLEEALAGYTAAFGESHPDTRNAAAGVMQVRFRVWWKHNYGNMAAVATAVLAYLVYHMGFVALAVLVLKANNWLGAVVLGIAVVAGVRKKLGCRGGVLDW